VALATRGVASQDFIQDERRRFAMTSEFVNASIAKGELNPSHDERYPPTLRVVLTLGSDPAGVAAAELHAKELGRRLEPWGATCPTIAQWLCVDTPQTHVTQLGVACSIALDSLAATLQEESIEPISLEPAEPGLPPFVSQIAGALVGWRLAVERKLSVSPACWPPERVKRRPFAELPNPFEPLVELWMTGYILQSGYKEGDILRLYALQIPHD
jgi:hypothetical protein